VNATSEQQRAYRAILTRLADLDDESGSPVTIDHLKAVTVFTREELAAINAAHPQVIRDELQVDPEMLGAYWRGDIGPLDMLQHVREANENAAWEAVRKDLQSEFENRAEAAYERSLSDCFRGTEYAGYLAAQQAEAQRLK
jgi:hypothetical protein